MSAASSAWAQTMYDALTFSENDYAGTARTLAMGNAFTALGGDPGSITINPAGSAVAKYSQFVFSPGLAFSVNKANGTIPAGAAAPTSFDKTMRNTDGSFWMPNIGFTINFDTHRKTGVKNVTLGFIANVSNTYRDVLYARGLNTTSSFAGGLATMAYGFEQNDLNADNAYDIFSPADWKYVLGWRSYIMNPDPSDPLGYCGVTENVYDNGKIDRAGNVNQTFGRSISGNKYDCILNLGLNISDVLYIGANLGLVSLRYSSEEYFIETPEEPSFFQTGFQRLKYNSLYQAAGTGVYGKFGFIATPPGGFRLGAAIQTPTAMTPISEAWRSSASVASSDRNFAGSDDTPEGQYKYNLRTPMRFNVGAAYSIESYAVLSVDYEMCDYRKMRFAEYDTADNSEFDSVNDDIREYMGISNMLRAGIEIKPFSSFAVRAGYGLMTAPDKLPDGNGMLVKNKAKDHKFSFGLGYSSNGSFYADAAFAARKYAKEYVMPYETALIDDGGIVIDGNGVPVVDYNLSPEILSRKWLWTAVITFGFRF